MYGISGYHDTALIGDSTAPGMNLCHNAYRSQNEESGGHGVRISRRREREIPPRIVIVRYATGHINRLKAVSVLARARQG